MDDPQLLEVLRQRPDGPNKDRRWRGDAETIMPPSGNLQAVSGDLIITDPETPLPSIRAALGLPPISPPYKALPPVDGDHLPLLGPDSPPGGPAYSGELTDEDVKPDRLANVGAPFTDSGYASAPPRNSDRVMDASEDNMDESDSKTVISMATTVLPNVAQHSISEVCNNMYNSIHRQLDNQNLEPFLEALPDIIKSFALHFAHLDPTSANRRIMHFVYSRYR
jgi:hypothetical protein